MYDRIHLRTTYYNFAKHLESKGDYSAAIPKLVHAGDYIAFKFILIIID